MGIRIHKQLGFVAVADTFLDIEQWAEVSLVDLYKGLDTTEALELKMDLGYPELDLNKKIENYIIMKDHELIKGKSVFIFVPPYTYEKEWSRYNNIIDYLETDKYDASLKIKYIYDRILPYSNPMIVSKTGSHLNLMQSDRIRMLPLSRFDALDPSVKQELQDLGIDFSQPLSEQIHMEAPKIIQELAKQAGIFDVKVLKLAIVTYWD
jgi:hypothetical protein